MALITCPECGKQISSLASSCPNCGFPIKEYAVGSLTENNTVKSKCSESITIPYTANGSIELNEGLLTLTKTDGSYYCSTDIVEHFFFAFKKGGFSNTVEFVINNDNMDAPVKYIFTPQDPNYSDAKTFAEIMNKYAIFNGSNINKAAADLTFAQRKRRDSKAKAPKENAYKRKCPVCGCSEFDVEFIRNAVETKEKSEVKKKGLATRTANSIGRAGMIAMTGGLWAFTPKKSKYAETSSSKTKYVTSKVYVCKNCGHSWEK